MYADRYARPGRAQPGSLAASLTLTSAMIAGVIFSAPHVVRGPSENHLTIRNLPLPVPPPPKPLPRTPQPPRPTPLTAPTPLIPFPRVAPILVAPPLPPTMPVVPEGNGIAATPTPLPSPSATMPALIDPTLDPRYADALQPDYPPDERRAGREGRVFVRVLVGVDGRVKDVARVSATSDAFFDATRRHALTRWRFRPGTRGGVPVEAWRTMSVTFVMADG